MNDSLPDLLASLSSRCKNREDFWRQFINAAKCRVIAEIGVFKGDFSARMLAHCTDISSYYLVDPWRHLDRWNKPANRDDETFEEFRQEVMDKTERWADVRAILRGTSTEVAHQVGKGELDLVYIDGDHTLRGIMIDLLTWYPKVREGGFIVGDDFCDSPWQHSIKHEPTLVFPTAVHFAEALGLRIFGLPWNQFLIEKDSGTTFEFIDLTGTYGDTTLLRHLNLVKLAKLALRRGSPRAISVWDRIRAVASRKAKSH